MSGTNKNMSKNSIKFGEKEVNKSNFYKKDKKWFKINDIDVDKILISKKESYGKYNSYKSFIGYNGNGKIRPLIMRYPQMVGYFNCFKNNINNNKTMSFKVESKILFKKYLKTWNKLEN